MNPATHEAEAHRNPLPVVGSATVVSCAMRDATLSLVAAAFLMLAPALARAADPPPRIAIRLSYIRDRGAEHCPPEQTLHDEVAIRMGYDPFTPDAPDRIVATLKRSPGGLLKATVERFDSKNIPQWEPQ